MENRSAIPSKFRNMMLEKDEEDYLDDHVKYEGVLLKAKEERKILHTIKTKKANWVGHILRRNCLLKHDIEGKIEGARKSGRRRKLLQDKVTEKRVKIERGNTRFHSVQKSL
jgi:hypothetical protein